MKRDDAAREAKLQALRDFSADTRMQNHLKPLGASKATDKPQDCTCGDDAARRMSNHTKPLRFSKDISA